VSVFSRSPKKKKIENQTKLYPAPIIVARVLFNKTGGAVSPPATTRAPCVCKIFRPKKKNDTIKKIEENSNHHLCFLKNGKLGRNDTSFLHGG
jgi:hypothetical protein